MIINQKQKLGQYCICIYVSEKISLEKYLCSPMYSGGHTVCTWYLHNAATRGLRSIHHQTGGPGCRGALYHHNQALRHSRKSTSLSEMKGVWYLWRSEAASEALRPPSSRYTEEEQFMELFLKVNWRIKRKASIEITSVSMPVPSMLCSYILTRQAPCFGLNLLFQLDLAS